MVEALVGLLTTLVLAQLGLALLQDRRLSRMEGRWNGVHEIIQGIASDMKHLPCHHPGWRQQEPCTGKEDS